MAGWHLNRGHLTLHGSEESLLEPIMRGPPSQLEREPPPPNRGRRPPLGPWGGGGLAQGLGTRLFAFGGAYWPLATAHSDPLWARMCFGCVNGAPG